MLKRFLIIQRDEEGGVELYFDDYGCGVVDEKEDAYVYTAGELRQYILADKHWLPNDFELWAVIWDIDSDNEYTANEFMGVTDAG